MKFSTKITIWMSLLIAIVFSLGGYIIIKNNFDTNLQSSIEANLAQHTMERYALESALNREMIDRTTITEKQVSNSLHAFSKISNQNHRIISAYDTNKKQFFSSDYRTNTKLVKEIIPKKVFQAKYQVDAESKLLNVVTYIEKGTYDFYLMSSYDISFLYSQREEQLQSFFLLDLFLTFLSFVVIMILSRYLTRPITQLSETSKKILKGAYDERCDIKTNDEIGELADSFNQMSESLACKIHDLEEAAKQKDAFIASFTHEIKTPMTAIIGYSDLLRQGLKDNNTIDMAHNFIFNEGKRLESLSHDLLDIYMMQNTNIGLEVISIKQFCENMQKELLVLYPYVNIDVAVEEANIWGKASLLDCLLRNLVSNAVHAEGSPIKIEGVLNHEEYTLSVIDHGKGIPKDSLQNIKDPFYRVDKSRSRSFGGNGLGLAICERIAQVHYSTLQIESTIGIGTKVTIILKQVHDEK